MSVGSACEKGSCACSIGGNALAISLLDGIGRADFEERLAKSIKQHVNVDAGLVLLYRRNNAPKILFNDWRTNKGLSDIQHYLGGSYRLDPFYRLALDNGEDGLYRLSQIAPSINRTRYYLEYYQYSGLHDEYNFFVSLDAHTKVVISLGRRCSHDPFSGCDARFLQAITPLLSTAILRHYRDLRPETLDGQGRTIHHALAQATHNFGRSVLTDRECEIAQLIIRGYSVKGAAAKLRISPATVKLHRRNLYAKLDIASQTALFSMFIDAVSSAKNVFDDPLADYLTRRNRHTGDRLAN